MLFFALQTIGVCLQHYSTNYLTEGVIIKKEEKKVRLSAVFRINHSG